jgi:prepilin-type N-terminal cleavage/methylation domain-containing protein
LFSLLHNKLMENHSQKGFSAVEAIIVLVVVAVLALGGWYIWKKNNNTDTSKNTASQQKETPKEDEKPVDGTEDWITYTNEKGKYSLKHPASWVSPSNLDMCSEGLVLLAPTKASLGACASEGGGQVMVSSDAGDLRDEYNTLTQSFYKDVQTEAVTVDGVEGTKYATTVLGMGEGLGAWPDNTKIVRYIFVTGGRTYIATYVQEPDYPDALSDFNQIITKTLKFTK